jgi:hypothetical protein
MDVASPGDDLHVDALGGRPDLFGRDKLDGIRRLGVCRDRPDQHAGGDACSQQGSQSTHGFSPVQSTHDDETLSQGQSPAVVHTRSACKVPEGRERAFMLLFVATMTAAAGNTALQSVLPAIGRSFALSDTLVAGAFALSALFWTLTPGSVGAAVGQVRP